MQSSNLNVILHIDMDAFFAAVEQRDNPRFRGKPVIIGANPKKGKGRGVVSTCSYEARTYGIHSAMPISIAYRFCPRGIFLPVDGAKYSHVSDEIFKILYDFSPDIEPISIDEAFIDITGSYHFYKTPRQTAIRIKERIKDELKLTASIGIAPVKFVAKIASDLCKPDGLLEVKPEGVLDFLRPLAIDKLWGVGPKTKKLLEAMHIKTIGDLADTPAEALYEELGENGSYLHALSLGLDDRRVEAEEEVKSVSNEHTFKTDTNNKEKIYKTFLYLSEKVSRRLRKSDLKGKTLTVKIRLEGFDTYSRAYTFGERTNFSDVMYKKAKELFDAFYTPGRKIRLLGIKMSNFEDPYVQESLFKQAASERSEHIHKAIDRIKDKYGEDAIHRGI